MARKWSAFTAGTTLAGTEKFAGLDGAVNKTWAVSYLPPYIAASSDITGPLALKATLASPTFTGVPAAPTAAPGTNTTQLATTAFVTAAITALGTMATQAASAVNITGGTLSGITALALAPAADTAGLVMTGGSVTGSGTSGFVSYAGTWNTSGSPTAMKLNVTNTASGTSSLLLDLQVGGVSQFKVRKDGRVDIAGSLVGATSIVCNGSSGLQFNSRSILLSASDGAMVARNNANSSFSFFQAKLQTDTNYTAGAIVPTGYLTLYDAAGTAYRVPCVV